MVYEYLPASTVKDSLRIYGFPQKSYNFEITYSSISTSILATCREINEEAIDARNSRSLKSLYLKLLLES